MTKRNENQTTLNSSMEAKSRFNEHKNTDPFPNIPPALLNSADIHDYIETTGLLYPYTPKYLKSSSYEVQVGDEAYFWDKHGEKQKVALNDDAQIELPPNGLVFFKTLQEFRLPPYMAVRFNLRITNVHRGLLLGTGPLVDPGFEGHLYIPLHNLTNNSYFFSGGDPFIWVEFTKTSPLEQWGNAKPSQRTGVYNPFRDDKKWLEASHYFNQANSGKSIRNATPAIVEQAQKDAKSAKSRITYGGWAAVFTVIVTAYFSIPAFFAIITDSVNLSQQVAGTISEFQDKYRDHLKPENSIDARLSIMASELKNLEAIIENLDQTSGNRTELEAVNQELKSLKSAIKALRSEMQNTSAKTSIKQDKS